jgi:NADPH2:quinone reductase
MRAIQISEFGGPEVLRLVELPDPTPGPGQIRVRVSAAGVNFADVYQRTGLYKVPLPYVLGSEGAGTVDAVGDGVRDRRVGDRVAWPQSPGSYAERVVLPADRAVQLPDNVTDALGAASMVQGLTAHYLATSTYPHGPGDTSHVHPAAGGVGLLLCQIAKRRSARVIGTVSTREKAELARAHGADEVILYAEQDFTAEARRLTGGRGVQVVYDSVGKTTFDGSLAALAPRGLLTLYGQSSGPVPPFDPQRLNQGGSLYLTRPSLAHYIAGAELHERARELLDWIGRGELQVHIYRTYPLADAAQAHRDLESRRTVGKLLLLP